MAVEQRGHALTPMMSPPLVHRTVAGASVANFRLGRVQTLSSLSLKAEGGTIGKVNIGDYPSSTKTTVNGAISITAGKAGTTTFGTITEVTLAGIVSAQSVTVQGINKAEIGTVLINSASVCDNAKIYAMVKVATDHVEAHIGRVEVYATGVTKTGADVAAVSVLSSGPIDAVVVSGEAAQGACAAGLVITGPVTVVTNTRDIGSMSILRVATVTGDATFQAQGASIRGLVLQPQATKDTLITGSLKLLTTATLSGNISNVNVGPLRQVTGTFLVEAKGGTITPALVTGSAVPGALGVRFDGDVSVLAVGAAVAVKIVGAKSVRTRVLPTPVPIQSTCEPQPNHSNMPYMD